VDFVPENSLEEALLRDAAQFERLLLDAPLHVIGENEGATPQEASVKVPEGARLRISGIRRGPIEWLAVFTAPSRLQIYFENMPKASAVARYLTMSGRVLFETTKGAHLLLNPGYQNRELPPAEIARLLATPLT